MNPLTPCDEHQPMIHSTNMDRSFVLIVTDSRGFGEMIQQTLEETERFEVMLTREPKQAISYCQAFPVLLAIVDISSARNVWIELVRRLSLESPHTHLIVIIPHDNNLASQYMADINPQGYLTKPFYIPDLLEMVDNVLQLKPDSGKPIAPQIDTMGKQVPSVPFQIDNGRNTSLENNNQITSLLDRMLTGSAIQAAFIFSGLKALASMGSLANIAIRELSRRLPNLQIEIEQQSDNSGDLISLIQLETEKKASILYTRLLQRQIILVLVFPSNTPLSKVRFMVEQISQAFSLLNNNQVEVASISPGEMTTPPHLLRQTLQISSDQNSSPLPKSDYFSQMDYLPSPGTQLQKNESPQSTFEEPVNSHPDEEIDLFFEKEVFTSPTTPARPNENAQFLADTQPVKIKLDEPPPTQSLTQSHPSQEQKGNHANQANTRPHVLNISTGLDEFRSSSPVMYFINYACVMIPRLPHHQLSGELALRLPDWIGQVCLAFGWRLEHLALYPGHIQWVVNASPSNSPNYIVRTIRQLTSQRIFAEFPALGNENPSRDFWATGYLIISGSQPPTMQLIRDFIIKVREHQGAAIGS